MSVLRNPGSRRLAALLIFLGGGLVLAGCGGGGLPFPIGGGSAGTCTAGSGTPVTISGTVRYERLTLAVGRGLDTPTQVRPARFVDVDVRVAGGGGCYARGHTDANGDYSIVVVPDPGATLEVAVFSRTLDDPAHAVTMHEADPPTFNFHSETNVFSHVSGAFAGGADRIVDLTVPYTGGPANRPAIGFAALDTILTCWDAAEAALGTTLPPLHLYTRLGNNTVLNGVSYYSHSARAIAILGGAAGNPDDSDTDYFDDGIVAHEFSHYVDRHFSHSMSRGRRHGGEPIEPNFAWSEGSASGFGCLLLENPWYIDTNNTSGTGVLFEASIEDVTIFDPDGIGGEFTVAEIVWDLGDGGSGPADTDGDPAAVSLGDLYRALTSFQPATDGPYVGLFADRLVNLIPTPITAGAMNAVLSGGTGWEDQDIRYPLVRAEDVWPKAIAIGGSDGGTLDSLPGGPTKNMCRGITSSAWYHLVLATPTVVNIGLVITPIPGSGDNLDLYLTTNQDVNTPIAVSANAGATPESINISLGAGTYVIRVEAVSNCISTGNRAAYALTVN